MESVWDTFRVGQNSVLAPQAAQMQQLTSGIGILSHLNAMRAQEELKGALARGDTAALMRTPGGIDILGKLATQQNSGITGALHSAQLGEIQRNAQVKAGEQQAKGALASLLSPMGSFGAANIGNPEAAQPTPNAQVFSNDAEAMKAMQAAEAIGTPFTGNVPNPANVKALTVAAGNSVPRGTANALMGVGANGQVMAPRSVQDADSPTGWSWLNPRDGSKTPGAPIPPNMGKANAPTTPNSAAPLAADFNKTGDEFLATLPEQDRTFVKKLANYDIDPKTLSTRGGEREKYLRLASQLNPDFDQKNYNAIANAVNRFATGQQGNTVRSLNVAIEHMDTARRLGDALKNTDVPLFNQVANEFATQTGKPAPTNFNAVKEIVADEVVKGVIGGTGALADREAAAKKIRDAASPAQMNGVLDSWTELLVGQVRGLERQYEAATMRKDFRTRGFLTQRTLDAISGKPLASSALAPSSGLELNGYKFPNQQALDAYKKAAGL